MKLKNAVEHEPFALQWFLVILAILFLIGGGIQLADQWSPGYQGTDAGGRAFYCFAVSAILFALHSVISLLATIADYLALAQLAGKGEPPKR